jgi:predicted MFS family arabinose efflux permease
MAVAGALTASDESAPTPQRRLYGVGTLVAMACVFGAQEGAGTGYSTAIDSIKKSFHVSDFAVSLVSPGMKASGVLGGLLMGVLSDRMRRGHLLMWLMVLWTVATLGNAVVPSFAVFYGARLVVAFAESPDAPVASLVGDYYAVEHRGKRYSQLQIGATIGAIFGLFMTSALVDRFGWRAWPLAWAPFGALCIVLTARMPEPARGRQDAAFDETRLGDVHDAEVAGEHSAALAGVSLWEATKRVLAVPTWTWTVLGLTCATMFEGALSTFGVSLYKRTFHLSSEKATAYLSAGGAGALIGVLGGGFLADRLLARGIVRARVWVTAAGWLAAPIALVPALAIARLPVTIPLFFVASFCFGLPAAPMQALLVDVMVPELRGRAAAVRNVADAITATGTVLVGGVSTAIGSLRVAFITLIPLFVVGGFCVVRAARTYTDDIAFVVGHARRTAT